MVAAAGYNALYDESFPCLASFIEIQVSALHSSRISVTRKRYPSIFPSSYASAGLVIRPGPAPAFAGLVLEFISGG